MLDLHVHLLPGVDDGAASMDEACEMARLAVADGIDTIICTPHCTTGPHAAALLAQCERLRGLLQQHIADKGLQLKLLPGAEWMIADDLIPAVLHAGRLGQSRAFLFELLPYLPTAAIDGLVFAARLKNLIPVLAHPERNPWLFGDNPPFAALAEGGCFFQLTAGSLTGNFGRQARRNAEYLVLNFPESIVLASDAHNTSRRPPSLRAGYDALDRLDPRLANTVHATLETLLRPTLDQDVSE